MTTNNNNVKTNETKNTNELSFELKQEIVELIKKYKKRDIKKLETLYGVRNIDLYKHDTIKEIMKNELELENYKEHMVVYYQISKVMDNSMFSNIVTNGDEEYEISKYIKQVKKGIGFLEIHDYDIKLKEDEYLSDKFYQFIDSKWGLTLDNINDPNIPLKLLIDSPMGSGKSTLLGMMKNIVILKDTITLVENSVEDLKKMFPNKKIYCEHGSSKNKGSFEDGSIIVSTYNQIVNLDSKLGDEWLFILDEEHKLVVDISYKQDVLKEIVYVLMNKRGRYISMSGTPLKYGPLKYDQVVRVSKESNKRKVLELLCKDSNLEGRLYDILKGRVNYEVKLEETTIFYVIQDTTRVERVSDDIRTNYPNLNVCEITSDLVNGRIGGRKIEGKVIKDKISSGDFSEYDVVITTTLLREGVSLFTNRKESIFLIDDNPNLLTILQQHDRVRKCEGVRVIIMDKKEVKDTRGEFKGNYKISKIKDSRKNLISKERVEELKETFRVEYRYMLDMFLDGHNVKSLSSGLSTLESNLKLNHIRIIKSGYNVDFIELNLDNVYDLHRLHNKLERVFFKEVERYLRVQLGFKIERRSSDTTIDNKSIKEEETNRKITKVEKGIDVVFNTSDEDLYKMKMSGEMSNSINKVYFLKSVLSRVTNLNEEEMKEFIRQGKNNISKEIVRDYFIKRGEETYKNQGDKESREMLENLYLNEQLKLEVKLSTILKVGVRYTKNDIVEILYDLGVNYDNPIKNVKNVFDIESSKDRIGDWKEDKKVTFYTILNKKVDSSSYPLRFNEDYLNNKFEDVYNLLTNNVVMEDEVKEKVINLVNPYTISKVFSSKK